MLYAAAGAAPIPGLYNTGLDSARALLPSGAVDPHYQLIQSADPGFPGPAAIVLNDSGYPIGTWLANGPTSKWLSPQASQAVGNAAGNYTFRTTFDLTGLEPATALLSLRVTSDNALTAIYLNGVATGLSYGGDFTTLSSASTLSSGFVDGLNTLDFVVNNGGPAANPTGFRAEISGTALTAVFAPPGQPLREPLGPSNRRSGLTFSEIMFHPRDRADGLNLEFVEIYNSNPWPEDLSGWRLAGAVDWALPDGATIAGRGFLVLAPAPADIESIYGITGVLGGFTNHLANAGGTLQLVKRSGAIVLDVTYSDQPPWPAETDGAGHSLVLVRPSFGDLDPRAWAASAFIGGSPGAADSTPGAPEDFVVINELLAHTDPPLADFVELYNAGPFEADLGGCWLTDERNTNKFRIPAGTILASQGFVAFDETALGFALSGSGETIYLVSSNQTRVIDAARYRGQASGVSLGRSPDGAPFFSALSSRTPGGTNAPPLLAQVVFNEIMFNPLSGRGDDEYVELFNRGPDAVNLGGWRLSDGISMLFPSNTVLSAGEYLVIAKNAARCRTNYAGLTAANCLGDYSGNLANGGERLALERPDAAIGTNAAGQFSTNSFWVVVNEVTYRDRSQWAHLADGGGSSLELIDAHADNREPGNWADSDESAKAPWTALEFTGTIDNAMSGVSADQVQLFLLGEGEALVDNVEVVSGGVNRVPNPTFESGTSGWVFQGTQVRSSWETSAGYNSARCLHLRASDRGEPIVNRVQAPLSPTLTNGTTNVTLRAKVRWLAGAPEFLMRLHGGGLELAGSLQVPANLGTPGARNSRARDNTGPAITDVSHRPVLPPADQPVHVLARVQDPDGVAGVVLKYRLDPGTSLASVPMRDDGLEGDLLAGDGIFTAVIPGQPDGTLVAFRIEAVDAAAVPAASQFPRQAPAREGLIRVGDQFIDGPFGNYRIWMTQATLSNWATRGNLSNDPLEVTFVYGQHRVVYSAGSLYAGSPAWSPSYNSPVGNLCAYDIVFPGDDLVLNGDKLSLDIPIRDVTNQREQLMHWVADQYDLPNLYRRDVHLFVNGYKRGSIYHDTQQPDGDFLEEWFPSDPAGTLVKSAQWSEGDPAGGVQGTGLPSLERFTSGGRLKVAAYRWPWRLRAADSQLDYTNFLSLVEAVNAPTNGYQSVVEGLVNVEDWMRMFAMNDLCGYWDAFGNPNRKNTYLYKPQHGTWRLIPWDFDVGMGASNNNQEPAGPDAALFPVGVDPTLQRLNAFPPFLRAYWRELQFGANTILPSPAARALLAAKDEAYRANGLSFTSPFVASGPWNISVPAWMDQRRAFLLGQLATVATDFALLTPTSFATNRNLALLRGTAPVSVRSLTVNGVSYPITWVNVTTWTLQVPLAEGTNTLALAGLDRDGQVLSDTLRTLTVEFTGAAESALDKVVINEIMYNPLLSGASYVELFNVSSNTAFDLSGWVLNGLDFTFPPGTIITNRQYLLLVKDGEAFMATYGISIPVLAEFAGSLQNDGETLTLIQPGATPAQDVVVDQVKYGAGPPWPAEANGTGSSLQLIDPTQDNRRPGNWQVSYVPAVYTPEQVIPPSTNAGWRMVSITGSMGIYRQLYLYLNTAGDVYVDDLALVKGTTAAVGSNYIKNGDFELALTNGFTAATNCTNSSVSADRAHGGSSALHLVFDSPGSNGPTKSLYQTLPTATVLSNGAVVTLSFWYLVTTNAQEFNVDVQRNAALTVTTNVTPLVTPGSTIPPILVSGATNYATPGAANTVVTNLPAFPALWLNEIQPQNLTGLTNRAGQPAPWIELYNAGTNDVPLGGLYLSDNYTNLTNWMFPAGAVINPGEFKVIFADGQVGLSTTNEPHTSFALGTSGGSLALSRLNNGKVEVMDYLDYAVVRPDYSYGSYPDGQPFGRRDFYHVTPGAPNNGAAPPLVVRINEWMADNQRFLADPADGQYEDWFELYNAGVESADLGGYYLTDDLVDKTQFQIPNGYVIPAGGYLLVWADGEPGQNGAGVGDLHVNFQLAKGGEAIGLYGPDGVLVDGVVFGLQGTDVSEGRDPDGSTNLSFLEVPTPGWANRLATPPVEITVEGTLGAIRMSWGTVVGRTYRLEASESLEQPGWGPVAGVPDITGTGGPVQVVVPVEGLPQRFFRVFEL